MKARAVASRALLVFAGVAAGGLLAEIILRLWTPEILMYKKARRSDPVLHHVLRPSTSTMFRTPEYEFELRTNFLGLRDDEIPAARHGEMRILVVGDSFVEGIGVPAESTMVGQLERQLNEARDGRVHVVNCGVESYSPIIQYLWLKNVGLSLDPQLVVLCYDMTDMPDDITYAGDAEFDSTGAPMKVNPTWPEFGGVTWFPRGPVETFLRDHFYTLAFVSRVLTLPRPRRPDEPKTAYGALYWHTADTSAARWEDRFRQSESYVRMIRELLMGRGVKFVLSTHPHGHQVSALEWTEGRKFWGFEPGAYASPVFNSLQLFAQRERVPFLNMTDAFRRRSKGHLYYPVDGHWTDAGNRVAADTLFEFLVCQGLITR